MRWASDFALGARLAVGSGRTLKTSLFRLTLATIGIGLSTAVLLLLAAGVTAMVDRNDRVAAREPQPADGTTAPLYLDEKVVTYRGAEIRVGYLEPMIAAAPVPPGVQAIPAAGDMVVSPAFARELDADPDLRARFAQRVVGIIAPDGLAAPNELWAYAGADGLKTSSEAVPVAGFGVSPSFADTPPQLLFLGMIVVLVVLVPLLVFVAATSRIAGAERERRLSALRLAGAGARQVRRIAAAESLIGAVTGGLLGLALFLVVRPFAARVDLAGVTVFDADFVPAWPLVVAVFLLLPVITVGSAWFGMRRLVIEPLGVVRQAKAARRRGWWRLLLVALGVLLLLPDKVFGVTGGPSATLPYLGVGIVVLLIGLPTLMPWVTEVVVARVRGGFPSWQLAIRRLQLDSGTPTRVVAGVVVALAGVIALQSVLVATGADAKQQAGESVARSTAYVYLDAGNMSHVVARVRAQPGVQAADPKYRGRLSGNHRGSLLIASCDVLERDYQLPGCVDGDAFVAATGPRPGETLAVAGSTETPRRTTSFTVPVAAKTAVPPDSRGSDLVLLTPGAAAAVDLSVLTGIVDVRLDPADSRVLQRVYAAVAPLQWHVLVAGDEVITSAADNYFLALRGLAYAGALLTLSLAGVSLLVMTIGQISERRRPLAAMSAAGVPRGVLARSLLWQNAVPVVFGMLAAAVAGIGIGSLSLRLLGGRASFSLDGNFVVVVALAALALVLAVTAATLPALRSATKLEALREV